MTPEAKKRHARDLYLQRKYDITLRQFNLMMKLQGGRCRICDFKPKPGGRSLDVDHDHTTNVVRGLACFTCNKYRIGKNTLETAKRVVEYLKQRFDGRQL